MECPRPRLLDRLSSIPIPLRLVGLGGLSAAVYWFGLVGLIPLLLNLSKPLLDLGKITGYRWEAAVQFGLSFCALYALYLLAYRWCGCWRPRATSRLEVFVVVCFAACFSLLLVVAYPATAADIFDYIMHLRVFTVYGADPHITAPSFFSQDPLYSYAAWPGVPSLYGPLWTWMSVPVSWLRSDQLLPNVLGFKALAILLYFACAALIYTIPSGISPARRLQGLVLFAWNPMVIWEVAGNAHNDIAMVPFALLGCWAVLRRREDLALPALVAAGLVKFTNGLLAPLALARALRERPIRLPHIGLGLAISAFLTFLVVYPFWDGVETFSRLAGQSGKMTTSLGYMLSLAWEELAGQIPPVSAITAIVLALFLVFYLRELLLPDLAQQDFPTSAFRVMFYFLCIALLWYQPWYVLSLLALGAICSDTFYGRLAIVYSATGIAAYVLFIYIWVINFDTINLAQIQVVGTLLIHGPPVAWWIVRWRQNRRAYSHSTPAMDTSDPPVSSAGH